MRSFCSDIDECINVTCQNGGTCVDSVASFSCACANGYTDPKCGTGN